MDVLLCCCLLLLLASAASAGSERCVRQGKAAYSPSLSPVPHGKLALMHECLPEQIDPATTYSLNNSGFQSRFSSS